jgi:hypothetical protein
MSTLYALIFACFLLQVFNAPLETPAESMAFNEHSTLGEYIVAVSNGQDEEHIAPSTIAAAKLIGQAATPSLDGSALNAGAYINDDGYTASVIVPGTPKIEDDTGDETGAVFFGDDAGWDFMLPDTVHTNRYYLVD